MRKKKYTGREEMKIYLQMIAEEDDQRIAFSLGTISITFELLCKALGDSGLSLREQQCLKLGRLTAILDLLTAYRELHQMTGELKIKQKRNMLYV